MNENETSMEGNRQNQNKPLLNTAILGIILVLVLVSAFDLSLTALLGYVDFVRCWDAIGSNVGYVSVDNLPYLTSIEVASEHYDNGNLYTFLIYLVTFIPILATAAVAKKLKTKFYTLLFTLCFVIFMWDAMGMPSDLHDCDRKSSTGGFILLFSPLFLFLPFSFFSWLTLKYYDKK